MLVSLTVRGICFAALCLACLLPSRALQAEPGQVHTAPVLNVATLNIAHGRGTSYNQMLTSGKQIRTNLDAIADVLNQQAVDVLALQEADRASRWSGRFDHVEYLARAADYTHAYAGVHATSFLFSFGTALLSRTPLLDFASRAFEPTPPTLTKGYVRGTLLWNPGQQLADPLRVTLISLHLDFSRPSVRRAQMQQIVEDLGDRDGPLILMGDFNSEGEGPESLIQQLCAALKLKYYADGGDTYRGSTGGRLDWILIPEELEFAEHLTLDEALSDHRLVLARITLPDREQQR